MAAELSLRQRSALDDVQRSRDSLREHRKGYHLALVIADDLGVSHGEIASALDTRALYVANTIRSHRAGECGCS